MEGPDLNVVPTTCKCVSPDLGEMSAPEDPQEIGEVEFGIMVEDVEKKFQNKTAVVSNPLTPIGHQVIADLLKQGVLVYAVGGSYGELYNLRRKFPSIETIAVDLAEWKPTEIALSKIDNVDFLINCGEYNVIHSVADVSEDEVDNFFKINLKGVINITRIVIKKFVHLGIKGAIVNVSSQASKAGLRKQAVYCASKAGLDGYTRAAALELASSGIRINCVNPTVYKSELDGDIWSNPKMSEPMLSRIPMKTFCEVNDVSDAIMFLLSEQASFITGVCLSVDGGFTSC